jgi:hypothetical protein
MFLYVFKDGSFKQLADNPSVIDLLGVKSGLLNIFKTDGKTFKYFDKDFNCWQDVEHCKMFSCKDGRVHQ